MSIEKIFNTCVVVQFYPWFNFCYLLFFSMLIHDNKNIYKTKKK